MARYGVPDSKPVTVDTDDVRMRELRRGLRLTQEPNEGAIVGRNRSRKHLERDPAIERVLPRFVDDSGAAAPELAADAVVADRLSDALSFVDADFDEFIDESDKLLTTLGMFARDFVEIERLAAQKTVDVIHDEALERLVFAARVFVE